jgi:hypothetical protein
MISIVGHRSKRLESRVRQPSAVWLQSLFFRPQRQASKHDKKKEKPPASSFKKID